MLKTEERYGNIHINGMSIDIERAKIKELNEYLEKLEEKREKLIEQQNNFLSQIMG